MTRWLRPRRRRPRRRSRWRWAAIGLALLVVLAVALPPWIGPRVGAWLVVADPLEKAAAVVVLSGEWPFPAIEAAAIYRQGWASQVWLTWEAWQPEKEAAMERLGIEFYRSAHYNRQILERLGVPPEAIRLLQEPVKNTAQELRLVADKLAAANASRVIIVTTKSHSRRVREIWNALVGGPPEAIVRPATGDPFAPEAWWRSTDDARLLLYEVAALLNVWAGFPLQPR